MIKYYRYIYVPLFLIIWKYVIKKATLLKKSETQLSQKFVGNIKFKKLKNFDWKLNIFGKVL